MGPGAYGSRDTHGLRPHRMHVAIQGPQPELYEYVNKVYMYSLGVRLCFVNVCMASRRSSV